MSKKVIRLITLILAVAMIASLAVGCGGSDKPAEGNSPSGIADGVDVSKLEGTTVTYVTWKDPDQNEDGVAVDAFEKKYKMTVKVQLISQSKYVNTIASSIASGTQGDVFFENGDFPGSLNVMQPLDAAKLDLSDPIWNQALIKASTLDGHAYLVDAISNVWTEVDICVWNKNIFESNNLTTPTEYYEAGKWSFANFREAAKQVAALGTQYIGAVALGESILGAAGSSFFTYADNKMSVTVDSHLREVMDFAAQMRVDGYLKAGKSEFNDGNVGMALTNCFGLKKTGYFTTINPDHVRATYLPVWKEGDPQQVAGIYRGWGLIDGAQNPVGAGLFLREYLDVNNYELANTFHNQEVADFFFQVTGQYSENMIYYHGPDMVKTTGQGEAFHQAWGSQSDMKTYIDGKLPVMEEMCTKANEIIEAERKWIKDAEAKGEISKLSE